MGTQKSLCPAAGIFLFLCIYDKLVDHNDSYITAVKLEFFQAKIEAQSLRPYITYRLNLVPIFASRKNIDRFYY
jgi:hypothetical protein